MPKTVYVAEDITVDSPDPLCRWAYSVCNTLVLMFMLQQMVSRPEKGSGRDEVQKWLDEIVGHQGSTLLNQMTENAPFEIVRKEASKEELARGNGG